MPCHLLVAFLLYRLKGLHLIFISLFLRKMAQKLLALDPEHLTPSLGVSSFVCFSFFFFSCFHAATAVRGTVLMLSPKPVRLVCNSKLLGHLFREAAQFLNRSLLQQTFPGRVLLLASFKTTTKNR